VGLFNGLLVRTNRLIRPQDLVWICLFAALAIFGPDQTAFTTTALLALGILQVVEPKIPFFTTTSGSAVSFLNKLVICYFLIGFTDGIASSYWILLFLPVISAATSLGLIGTGIATVVACGAYVSFLIFVNPEVYYIPPEQRQEIILRITILPVVAYLTHQLAEASRLEARRYQAVAEKLAEANRNLQEAEAAIRAACCAGAVVGRPRARTAESARDNEDVSGDVGQKRGCFERSRAGDGRFHIERGGPHQLADHTLS